MTAAEILEELRPLGRESYKKILINHGASEPIFGVKIEDLKKFQKRIKKNYQLALDLFDTGVFDAMYLAGLVADDRRMTPADLSHWVERANSPTLSEYTVPWVAAEGLRHEMARAWIDSPKESIATSGWATLSSLVALEDDSKLDLAELSRLLERVEAEIHTRANRVRYGMNGFVISVGCYVPALTELALETAARIGQVTVEMGGTACKVPFAPQYIEKVRQRGTLGKKRKTVKC